MKKHLAVIVALVGILLILWLDGFFLQHAEMPALPRDMSLGLLLLVGFF